MAITATHKTTNKSDSSASSYNTASITPTANKLLVASVYSAYGSGTPNQPTLSGAGLTWVAIGTIQTGINRITLFRAMGASPSSGAVTIDFAGQSQDRCYWSITEFDGTDTSGTNGSGAIVQYASNYNDATANTTLVVTLSSFGNAGNATYGFFRAGNAQSAGSGFTLQGNADGTTHCASEFRADNDTSVDETWASSTATCLGMAIEIKVLSVFAPTVTTQSPTDITETTATGNGNVTSDGGATITERGICIGASANPTTAGTKFTASGTTGAFTAAITGLSTATHYHVRAYAINSVGTSYGSDVEFDSASAPPWRFENLNGLTFDNSDKKTIYAERLNEILDRLHALDGLEPDPTL